MKFPNEMYYLTKRKVRLMIRSSFTVFWLSAFSLMYVILVVIVAHSIWEWLRSSASVSNAEVIRNIAIPVGAIPALIIAMWRSYTANEQQRTDARGRLDDRYQKGVEMLGSNEPVVRLGGITILERLSVEHTEEFHVQVVDLLAKCVKHPPNQTSLNKLDNVTEVTRVIFRRSELEISVYAKEPQRYVDLADLKFDNALWRHADFTRLNFQGTKFTNLRFDSPRFVDTKLEGVSMDNVRIANGMFCFSRLNGFSVSNSSIFLTAFSNVDLSNAEFVNVATSRITFDRCIMKSVHFLNADLTKSEFVNSDFTQANLSGSDMKRAELIKCNLTGANLAGADLSGVNMGGSNLLNANLSNANLRSAYLRVVGNLTQEQLNEACQSEGDAPKLGPGLEWDKAAALERYKKSIAIK